MEKVIWISKEERILNGLLRKKGDKFDVSDKLAEQLISQKLVKDVYVEKKGKKKKTKEDKDSVKDL